MATTNRLDSPAPFRPTMLEFAPLNPSPVPCRVWKSETIHDFMHLSEKLDRLEALGFTDVRIELRDSTMYLVFWR